MICGVVGCVRGGMSVICQLHSKLHRLIRGAGISLPTAENSLVSLPTHGAESAFSLPFPLCLSVPLAPSLSLPSHTLCLSLALSFSVSCSPSFPLSPCHSFAVPASLFLVSPSMELHLSLSFCLFLSLWPLSPLSHEPETYPQQLPPAPPPEALARVVNHCSLKSPLFTQIAPSHTQHQSNGRKIYYQFPAIPPIFPPSLPGYRHPSLVPADSRVDSRADLDISRARREPGIPPLHPARLNWLDYAGAIFFSRAAWLWRY